MDLSVTYEDVSDDPSKNDRGVAKATFTYPIGNGTFLSIGAVYATLVRLESKGFVTSFTGEPTAERGGRAKRHFRITADGKGVLRNTHEIIQKMSAGLKGLQST